MADRGWRSKLFDSDAIEPNIPKPKTRSEKPKPKTRSEKKEGQPRREKTYKRLLDAWVCECEWLPYWNRWHHD